MVDGKVIAYRFETAQALFVFGTAALPKDSLSKHFPQYDFCFLKQVHGRAVVAADPASVQEADGHVTDRSGHALICQTADCVPILLASDNKVGSLHAGWRGVAANIVSASQSAFTTPPRLAVIGPHIKTESFEVKLDVRDQLVQAAGPLRDGGTFDRPHSDPEKRYVDLEKIVRHQLQATFPGIAIESLAKDTFSNPEFHSFRRDKAQAGRQYSFVVLKP